MAPWKVENISLAAELEQRHESSPSFLVARSVASQPFSPHSVIVRYQSSGRLGSASMVQANLPLEGMGSQEKGSTKGLLTLFLSFVLVHLCAPADRV